MKTTRDLIVERFDFCFCQLIFIVQIHKMFDRSILFPVVEVVELYRGNKMLNTKIILQLKD